MAESAATAALSIIFLSGTLLQVCFWVKILVLALGAGASEPHLQILPEGPQTIRASKNLVLTCRAQVNVFIFCNVHHQRWRRGLFLLRMFICSYHINFHFGILKQTFTLSTPQYSTLDDDWFHKYCQQPIIYMFTFYPPINLSSHCQLFQSRVTCLTVNNLLKYDHWSGAKLGTRERSEMDGSGGKWRVTRHQVVMYFCQ